MQRFAAACAARNYPADRFMLGSTNEYGGGYNSMWQPDRIRWNQYIRDAMPGHTIVEGPSYWKSIQALVNDAGIGRDPFVPWNDNNTMIDVHHYLGWDTQGILWICDQMLLWGQANDRLATSASSGSTTGRWATMGR